MAAITHQERVAVARYTGDLPQKDLMKLWASLIAADAAGRLTDAESVAANLAFRDACMAESTRRMQEILRIPI